MMYEIIEKLSELLFTTEDPSFIFGGPIEMIQDGVNGFYINPTHLEETATKILEFVDQCDRHPDYWQEISHRGIERVYSTYTWKIHTTRLLSLDRDYHLILQELHCSLIGSSNLSSNIHLKSKRKKYQLCC